MKTGKAIITGILGAAVMTLIMWIARLMGLPANLEMMLGTFTGSQPSDGAWVLGLLIHLTAGGVFALVYAACFEFLTHRAGIGVGIGIGAIHTIVSGLFLGAIPALHPLIPEQLPAPGLFMAGLGAIGVAAFTLLHLIFGAIVGGSYGQVRHPRAIHPVHHEPKHAH
jgi:hypothetical protein